MMYALNAGQHPVLVNGQPQQQYVILNPTPGNLPARPKPKVEYSAKNLSSVKWLTITQLILGCTILVLQIVTTGLNDHFNVTLNRVQDRIDDDYFFWGEFSDNAGTGIWVGILIFVAAVIGIQGYRKQKKGLIITHLVLNILLLMCVTALISTLSVNVSYLVYCRNGGETYSRSSGNRDYYNYYRTTRRTTTTPEPVEFLGEYIKGRSGTYYCSSAFYSVWLAVDAIILICAVFAFVVTLSVFVYNCIAACTCCRSTGCCGRCCGGGGTTGDVGVVSYYAHPGVPNMAPNTAVPQNQLYAQPVGLPMYSQAPTPVMAAAGNSQLPAGTAVFPMTTPAGVNLTVPPTTPAAAAAANAEEKWEDLPPEYAQVFQNQQM